MAISPSTRDFIQNLINYYVSEAASYKQFAEDYTPHITDVSSATFGIIVGCIYSGFLQAYANQKQKVGLEDMQEFHQIIRQRSPEIKKAILGSKKSL